MKKHYWQSFITVFLLIVFCSFIYIARESTVYHTCYAEAGSYVTAGDFLKRDVTDIRFLNEEYDIAADKPGVYEIFLKSDYFTYKSMLYVEDSIAPQADAVKVSLQLGETCIPKDFIKDVNDVTEVEIDFAKEPDFTLPGNQKVEILLTDEGNNQTHITSELFLSPVYPLVTAKTDSEPPSIDDFIIQGKSAEFITDMEAIDYTIPGDIDVSIKVDGKEYMSLLHIEDTTAPVVTSVRDIVAIIGSPVSYKKNIRYSDNDPKGASLKIDSSEVNLNKTGTYPITYTVTDPAGNTVTASANVIVKPQTYSEEEVNRLADAVLANMITPAMTPIEKVQAIFNYVKSNVGYISHSEKGNWVRAAYEGLHDRQGDCYVYACTSKILLTRAGIKNMDIEKIPAKSMHYWNLVDVGNGWYHFDTTPRKDHPVIFMWTDEELMAYSAQHKQSHNYDHTLYPSVN